MEFHQFYSAIEPLKEAAVTDAASTVIGHAARRFESAVKFDYAVPPEIFATCDLRILRLPYPEMLVRVRVARADAGLMDVFYLLERDDDAWWMTVFFTGERGLAVLGWGQIQPDDLSVSFDDFGSDLGEFNEMMLYPLWHFLMLLHHPDQRVESVKPSEKLNTKRRAGGKHPLVEYKVLTVLKPKIVIENDLGGTHASPRIHLRRGHFRRVAERMIWIREALVGDKSKGLLLKDYSVREAA